MRLCLRLFYHSVLRVASGMVVLLVVIAIYNLFATYRDGDLFQPPGQMVDVGGFKMHIHCETHSHESSGIEHEHKLDEEFAGHHETIGDVADDGEDVTILFDHALMTLPQQFHKVLAFPSLRHRARICTVDRPGYGFSEESPNPRTPTQQAEELHRLLLAAGEHPPFVLVGHSRGALNHLAFARKYPHLVGGIVALDPSPPGFQLPPAVKRLEGIVGGVLSLMPYVVRLGLVRLINYINSWVRSDDVVHTYHERDLSFKNWVDHKPTYWKAVLEEYEQGDEGQLLLNEEPEIKKQNWKFPLTVVSAGLFPSAFSKESQDEWLKGMHRLAAYSTDGKVLVAEESTHDVPAHQPEVVVQAISEILDKIKLTTSH